MQALHGAEQRLGAFDHHSAFGYDVERRHAEMGASDGARGVLAISLDPARKQPVGHVETGFILAGNDLFAFATDAPQHCVDQRLEMHRLGVGLSEAIGTIDRGMRRHVEEDQFAGPGQQDFRHRPGAIAGWRCRHEFADQGFELA